MGIEEVIDVIDKHDGFLVASHTAPDGDGIGSQFALFYLLKSLGKEAVIVNDDPLPKIYEFLPKFWHRTKDFDRKLKFDTAFIIECATLDRVGKVSELITEDMVVANIDHHASNEQFGKVNWVEPSRSSVGEMIYELYRRLNRPIGEDAALFLYLAIVTDTGSFRYANTTSTTHRVVSELLRLGVKPDEVAEKLYEANSISTMKLLSEVLSTIKLSEDGKISWLYVTRKMLTEARAELSQTEGFVNYARAIRGVKVALFFKEIERGGWVKVSLRSKSPIDADQIAKVFGGGGHPRAAGCRVCGRIDEIIPLVVGKVKESLQ